VEEIAFLGGKSKEDGSSPIPVGGAHCSQFAVLPSATEDGHLYAVQNTDSSLTDMELRLCTTRVAGKPAHIGFSDMIFGRSGGINEHGLCVTTSWGAPMMWPPCDGLPYFAMGRALLDRCHDVESALRTLEVFPVAWCTNVLVSDRGGRAALIEVAGEERAVTRIDGAAAPPFLCATNHYVAPHLHAYSAHRRRESVARRKTIAARLGAALLRVSVRAMRDLVAEPFPGGLCMHHYAEGMGTLWSTIYDVTEGTVEVCFGAPSSERNRWRTFGLDDPAGVTRYEAHVPNEPAAPGFWEPVEAER
jgi:predicted choloylglycine hydrolase